jgi:hypothetical protein
MKKYESSQNLMSLTLKTKNGATICPPEGLENTPFKNLTSDLGVGR